MIRDKCVWSILASWPILRWHFVQLRGPGGGEGKGEEEEEEEEKEVILY